jgi:hypothetical protein
MCLYAGIVANQTCRGQVVQTIPYQARQGVNLSSQRQEIIEPWPNNRKNSAMMSICTTQPMAQTPTARSMLW